MSLSASGTPCSDLSPQSWPDPAAGRDHHAVTAGRPARFQKSAWPTGRIIAAREALRANGIANGIGIGKPWPLPTRS